MRALALALALALPGCRGCDKVAPPEAGDEWPTGGRQGLLDGCIAQRQARKICDCLARRMPEQVPWRAFVQRKEDLAAGRQVNPATQAAIDRVTTECQTGK